MSRHRYHQQGSTLPRVVVRTIPLVGGGLTAAVVGAVVVVAVAAASAWAKPSLDAFGAISEPPSRITTPRLLGLDAAAGLADQPLYPGGEGDVTLVIENPNRYPMYVSALVLPRATHFAGGYVDDSLRSPRAGCSDATSGVTWEGSSTTGEIVRYLGAPMLIRERSNRALTLTGAAYMSPSAPAACEGVYLAMPPLAGVVAGLSADAPTPGPTADATAQAAP